MQDIAFASRGVTCRAWLCPPESEALRNARGYPALVMAHGTSGVREQLKHYVPRFTAAGMHVLLFDYRHFGASDGEPRQLLSVRRQLQDYAAALDCIRQVPGVDLERVALWGSSLAGGHVVEAAVRDGHVAAVISQAPALDNRAGVLRLLEYAGVGMLLKLTWFGMVDIVRSVFGLAPRLIPAGAWRRRAMRQDQTRRSGALPLPTFAWGSALGAALLVVLLLGVSARSWAQEAIAQEEPTPASVQEIRTPIERSFVEQPARVSLFPWLKDQLQDTPPFFRDTTLTINLRTFYFYRDRFDDSKSEAWALGGALAYQSGWLLDHVAIGAVLYTSQPLYAPEDRDGTGLLQPGQDGLTALGQLYGRVKLWEAHVVNLYRYAYNTPYLNKDDGRMVPKTFEGYTFQGAWGGKDRAWNLRYGGGYITKIKERDAEDFVWLSRDAGAEVERGVFLGGALFSSGRFSLGAINYYSDDIINIVYTEARYTWPVTERLGVLFAVQFTDQRSVGDDLLTGSAFDTRQVGVKTDLSSAGAILSLTYTRNAEGDNVRSPWSSYPGYSSAQVTFFDQAGESAFGAKLSYDFQGLGLTGVTAYALFVHGWGQVNPSTQEAVPDENEVNVDVQWRPTWRFLKGWSLRTRYGIVQQYEGPGKSLHDVRVIVNYELPLL